MRLSDQLAKALCAPRRAKSNAATTVVAALAGLVVTACSSGVSAGEGAAPEVDSVVVGGATTPAGDSSGSSDRQAPALAVEVVRSEKYAVSEIGQVALSRKYAAFALARRGTDPVDRLAVINLRTGDRRVVATSLWESGYISGVAVSGSTVVWVDQDRVASTWDLRSRWRMVALNLESGARRLLSSSHGKAHIWQPSPHADDRRVVWSEQVRGDDPAADGGSPLTGFTLRSWRTGSAKPVVLARRLRMGAGSERPVGRATVYVSIGRHRVHGHQDSNVRVLWPDKSTTRLSDSGRVSWIAANKKSAVWAEQRDPKRAEFSDPFSHWVRPVNADAPATRLQRGYSASNVVAGDAFAAWWPLSVNAIKLAALDGTVTGEIAERRMFIPARLAASGDLLAYASQRKSGHITVHVARVR